MADELSVQDDIAGSKKGDETSFAKLVRTWEPVALRFALRMLAQENDARDIVQEAFVRVWQNIDRYDVDRPFSTWLYKIVANLCLDRLRSDLRRRAMFDSIESGETILSIDGGDGPEARVSDRQLAGIVRRLGAQLSLKQRLVFTLRDLEDLPVEEVVLITGFSRRSVKSNLYHARRAVREMLSRYYQIRGG
jgi:RNA polymerase sigma-70 factor (ECF subfamily)